MKNAALWDVDFPRGLLSVSPCYFIAGYFQLVAQSAATFSRWFSARGFFFTLKVESIRTSETSVNARYTQRHIPEDDILEILQFDENYIQVLIILKWFLNLLYKSRPGRNCSGRK
jgi:hypothetical protein